jgi:hypothetical protein
MSKLLKSYLRDCGDYTIFIDVYTSSTLVKIWDWKNDVDVYKSKYILTSVGEIIGDMEYRIDNKLWDNALTY